MSPRYPFPSSNTFKRSAAALLIAFLSAGAALAEDTPAALPGAKLITAAEGHIKGAISVPYRERSAKTPDFDASKDQFDLSKLPGNKEAVVVIYCNGPECWKSFKTSIGIA